MSGTERVLRPVRQGLRVGAQRWPWFRRIVRVGAREFDRALRDDLYEDGYYGNDTGPVEIGTAAYTREATHGNEGAYLIWRWFPVRNTLDVGCAFGFFVEAQRELGIDASGYDVSQYALDHAALGARGHVSYGNLLRKLPCKAGAYELVSAFETLEHLPPEVVPQALAELRRVTSKYLIATIPSFGPNENGPGGWFDVKVRPERLDHYNGLGDAYEGPIPYDDLYRDEHDRPVEGHLTIASFDWWTKRFAEAGFERCAEIERAMHPHIARFGLSDYWNLYVLRVAGTPEPTQPVRTDNEIADVEKRFGLAQG